jgi:hypothetical protein
MIAGFAEPRQADLTALGSPQRAPSSRVSECSMALARDDSDQGK